MTNPSDYLKDLQQAEAAQGSVQLRTLTLEFAATLERLPRLAQEVDGWLNNAQAGVDFNALATRLEPQLVAATDWLLDYDMLPVATREAPAMQTFMQTAADTVTGRTVTAMAQKFQAAKLEAEKSLAQSNPLTALGYVDHGNGTITDTNTGLMWKQRREGGTYTFDDAVKRFNANDGAIRCGGFSDWRLPTIDELKTLILQDRSSSICEEAFPDSLCRFWSSSEDDASYAWCVNFYDGNVSNHGRYSSLAVRLVRASQ